MGCGLKYSFISIASIINIYIYIYILEAARVSTGLCVDVSSGVPPGNDIKESM